MTLVLEGHPVVRSVLMQTFENPVMTVDTMKSSGIGTITVRLCPLNPVLKPNQLFRTASSRTACGMREFIGELRKTLQSR